MKYCRFEDANGAHWGRVETVEGREMVTALLAPWPDSAEIHPSIDSTPQFQSIPLSEARLLAPVMPSKIIAVGRNYREHARELGNEVPTEPLIFFKPSSSVIGPCEAIELPPDTMTQRVDFEGELGVVIGRRCRNLKEGEDVRSYIRGYTCVNDVTARDLQKKDGQWARAKGFDTFCPVGPIVSDEIDPGNGVDVITRLNGEEKQRGNTRDFIFPLEAMMRYISSVMTLKPGDLISTGTPSGVGPMKAGDVVEVTVAGLGTLRSRVR